MTDGKPRFCLPFRISISLAFALITVPLLLTVIGTLYVRNVNLAREVAVDLIERATVDISEHVEALLVPLARVVDATTTLAKIDPDKLRKPDTFQYLLTVLESTPHAEMLYVGFERDGAFFQVRRLHPEQKLAGAGNEKPPPDANFVLRTIDPNAGIVADVSTYIAKWGQIVGIERRPPIYDPRSRPWYLAARNQTGLSISDAYIFFSTGQPGLTLSHKIATDAGTSIGAVGIDISLGALSEFLARQRIGKNGLAFIVDNNGGLVGYPKLDSIVAQKGSELIIKKAADIDDPRIVQAVTLRDQGAGNRFVAELENGTNFISFTPLPARFGKDWQIGVIAAESDFVGPIRTASLFMLAFGSAALLLAVLAILYVSDSLTRPLKRIVGETKRIRQFELGGGLGVHSRIVEINELANALDAMEAGLRSFGAYIPKALVRTIVSSGKDTGIGGERRTLTVLFTDIQDFTRRSEIALGRSGVRPALLALHRAVALHFRSRRHVDKFIGEFRNGILECAGCRSGSCRECVSCGIALCRRQRRAECRIAGQRLCRDAAPIRIAHRRSGCRQCRIGRPHAIYRARRAGEFGLPCRGAQQAIRHPGAGNRHRRGTGARSIPVPATRSGSACGNVADRSAVRTAWCTRRRPRCCNRSGY